MITTNAESDDGPNGFGETVSSPDNYGLTQTPRGLCSRRILEAGFYGLVAEEEKKEEEDVEEKENEEPVKDGVGEVVLTASEGLVAEEEKKEEVVEEEKKEEEVEEEKKEPVEDGAVGGPVVVEEADGSSGDAEGVDGDGKEADGEEADGVDAKKSCWTALLCCKIFRK